MTATYRLKGGGWLLATVLIAIGFYLVSLRVAEERKRLEGVNARIAAAERDIRALETEFDTRANLVQLEKWNGDTLALAAPTADQFVRDEGQLARIDVAAPAAAPAPGVQTAALVVPAIVAAPPAAAASVVAPVAPVAVAQLLRHPVALIDATARVAPRVDTRVDTRAASRPVEASPRPAARPTLRLASVERTSRAAKPRPQAVAMVDSKLLSDSTLGDILAQAKREARRR